MSRARFLFLVLIWSSVAHAAPSSFEVNLSEYKGQDTTYSIVEFNGALLEGSGDAIAEKLESAPHSRILFDLTSPGGRTKEADKVKAAMDRVRAKGSTVDTFVANGHSCESACTFLYIYGDKRFAGDTASFMFHSVQYENLRGVPDSFMTNTMLTYYKSRGLSADWISERQQQDVFSGVNDFHISGKDAFNQKIGLVTELWGPIVFHNRMPFDPQIHAR